MKEEKLQNFMWRVGHDPDSKDLVRCSNYLQTRQILGHQNECPVQQVYLRSLQQVQTFLMTLPGEHLNILTSNDLESFICTSENMNSLFKLWFDNVSLNPKRPLLGSLESLPRRFSLHLSQFLSMETFIKSSARFLLIIDDDLELDTNFLSAALNYIDQLPHDWDILNLYTNPRFVDRYQSHLRVGESQVSLTYQYFSPTCFVFSRNGARKYLWDCVFGVRGYETGNSNIDKNIDMRVANFTILEPFNDPIMNWHIDWSKTRRLKSFQLTPEARVPVTMHNLKSTLDSDPII